MPALEALPTELRIIILCYAPDLRTLSSLVHASPAYHQSYVASRLYVLRALVRRQVPDFCLSEAISAIRAVQIHAETPNQFEAVVAHFDRWRRRDELESLSGKSAFDELTNPDEIIALLRLQRNIDFMLERYCRTAPCPRWMSVDDWRSKHLPLQLSAVEKARFLRASYRIQLFSQLLGRREILSQDLQPGCFGTRIADKMELEYIWDLFFCPMPPWEVEEIICVWVYLQCEWSSLFDIVAADLSRKAPRYKDLRPGDTPPGIRELDRARQGPRSVMWTND